MRTDMKAIDELKKKVCQAIDKKREKIEGIGEKIRENPELGFKEFQTAEFVSQIMSEFSVPHETGLAITGVKGVIRGKKPGPTVALIGELDSLVVADHPACNPETGAAHACGHNAQIAGMLGAMIGIVDSSVIDSLAGSIVFFAAPAEEYVEVEYRMAQVRQGNIGFLGGKPELIRLGHFDDIDIAMMIHTHSRSDLTKVIVGSSSNGCVVKLVKFAGKAAHAGVAPHMGINALNATHIAMTAIHAQRETFKDDDTIRVHPIITRGGDLVNVVPSEVRMESYVRGKSSKAILDADSKVNRSLRAGALATGASVTIETLPGYLPLRNDPDLTDIFKQNSFSLLGEDQYLQGGHGTGSTDMGDISQIMPALHPAVGGATGIAHSADFQIEDKELAYLAPAKLLAMSVIDLLHDNAEKGNEILDHHTPLMTKQEYLTLQEEIFKTEIYDGGRNHSDFPSEKS